MTKIEKKAVLFDLGDTILNFGKFSRRTAIKQAAQGSYDYLQSLGVKLPGFKTYLLKNAFHIRMRYLWSFFTGNDFDSLETMKNAGTSRGVNLSHEQWQELNYLWYKPLANICTIEPDIVETLVTLQNMNISIGIVSNTFVSGVTLDRHLTELGLKDYFPMRMYSCDFDFRKPDVRIFNIAAERIGFKPEEIVFVGDRLDTDVKGSLATNMTSVLKLSHANAHKQAPSGVLRIEKLAELPELINKLNAGT